MELASSEAVSGMFECARMATRSRLSRSNRVKDQTPGYTPSAVDERSARLAANKRAIVERSDPRAS